MNYRTVVKPKCNEFNISHESRLLLVGSCFSESVGNKLIKGKFEALVNPFGILFNPISIVNTLSSIIEEREFVNPNLIKENGLFHSFAHHGEFSGESAESVLENINKRRIEATAFLKKTDVLIITLGSAWAYRNKTTNEIVANCHKLPSKEFERELLSVETIVNEMKTLILNLKAINAGLKIMFTVSPVRHWKDGAIENTLSKSILHVAVHQLINEIESTSYFPSYEMVIDDLRDYRFYKKDMLHPSEEAIDYVWSGFEKSFFSVKTIAILTNVEKIVNALNHRPFNPNSGEHQDFLRNQLNKIDELKTIYPAINFDNEVNLFKIQLT